MLFFGPEKVITDTQIEMCGYKLIILKKMFLKLCYMIEIQF